MQKDMITIRNQKLGESVCQKLQSRGFEAYYCPDKATALRQALALIPEQVTVSWGGSKSIEEIGLLNAVKQGNYSVIDRDIAKTPEERKDLMRKGLLCHTFLMGTNAITEDGELVNVDSNGNRVAALLFGPEQVIVLAGMNKMVKTVMDAATRARTIAAPTNAQRFAIKTPCQIDGKCHDCNVPDSICSYIVRTRRCKPIGRIKVILVGEALGY